MPRAVTDVGEGLIVEFHGGGSQVLPRMRERGGARDEEHVRGPLQQPGQCDLGRRDAEARRWR
jgi:hypothetical protein